MKSKIKTYLKITAGLFFAGWLIASVRFVSLSSLTFQGFKLENNPVFVSQEHIQSCLPETGKPLLGISLSALHDCLRQDPFVRWVAIRKDFPHQLKIKIIEQTPLGIDEETNFPVNQDGHLIEQIFDLPLIRVSGKQAIEKYPEFLKKLQEFPALMAQVKAVRFIGQRRWNLITQAEGQILLSESLTNALEHADIYLGKQSQPFKDILDVRDEKRTFITIQNTEILNAN